jgi:sulfur transfer protein SufE
VADVAAIPENMLERMGLADVLGILRSRGLRAIVARVQRGFADQTVGG